MKQYNYLIESIDSLSLKNKIQEIIKNNKFEDATFSSYDISEDQLEQALEDLDTYGLFSTKKVITIHNIDSLSIDNNKKLYTHLLDYLDNNSTDNLLIITANKLNNTKKLTKDLKKRMEYILVDMNPDIYIKQKLKDYKVSKKVIQLIKDACLDDITKIDTECEKLMNYRYDTKEIIEEDVDLLVVKKKKDPMMLTFDFVRELASKNKKGALGKYRELLDNEVEPIALLGLLASQIRIIYQVKILKRRNLSTNEIATVLSEKPYRISKTLELIHYYSEDELLKLMQKISDMDIKVKSTDIDAKFLIELFILNM